VDIEESYQDFLRDPASLRPIRGRGAVGDVIGRSVVCAFSGTILFNMIMQDTVQTPKSKFLRCSAPQSTEGFDGRIVFNIVRAMKDCLIYISARKTRIRSVTIWPSINIRSG